MYTQKYMEYICAYVFIAVLDVFAKSNGSNLNVQQKIIFLNYGTTTQ